MLSFPTFNKPRNNAYGRKFSKLTKPSDVVPFSSFCTIEVILLILYFKIYKTALMVFKDNRL
ncbi:MAG TPA: hypothetical protein DHV28_18015 [Ignavibacteriales bacterium]|nr:hypothetical protein [Ignavibacteriales bacterium]